MQLEPDDLGWESVRRAVISDLWSWMMYGVVIMGRWVVLALLAACGAIGAPNSDLAVYHEAARDCIDLVDCIHDLADDCITASELFSDEELDTMRTQANAIMNMTNMTSAEKDTQRFRVRARNLADRSSRFWTGPFYDPSGLLGQIGMYIATQGSQRNDVVDVRNRLALSLALCEDRQRSRKLVLLDDDEDAVKVFLKSWIEQYANATKKEIGDLTAKTMDGRLGDVNALVQKLSASAERHSEALATMQNEIRRNDKSVGSVKNEINGVKLGLVEMKEVIEQVKNLTKESHTLPSKALQSGAAVTEGTDQSSNRTEEEIQAIVERLATTVRSVVTQETRPMDVRVRQIAAERDGLHQQQEQAIRVSKRLNVINVLALAYLASPKVKSLVSSLPSPDRLIKPTWPMKSPAATWLTAAIAKRAVKTPSIAANEKKTRQRSTAAQKAMFAGGVAAASIAGAMAFNGLPPSWRVQKPSPRPSPASNVCASSQKRTAPVASTIAVIVSVAVALVVALSVAGARYRRRRKQTVAMAVEQPMDDLQL